MKLMKLTKIISINILIIIFLLVIFELIFGGWLRSDSFGFSIREFRNIKHAMSVEHDGKKYNYYFERNNLGFIGEYVDPKDIEIIFLGGSTGEESLIPPKFRIVDQINLSFKKESMNYKIVNASRAGKSTRGYVNDFLHWFPKIENLKPKVVIFYIGLNDAVLELPGHFDSIEKDNLVERFEDYIKNNSIIYSLKKKIQNTYFNPVRKYYGLVWDNLYINYEFVDYNKAKNIYSNIEINEERLNIIDNFTKNLDNLNKIINSNKFIPIFITQVQFDGLGDPNLFLINEYLKKFCFKFNYNIIKLDELITRFDEKDFYDPVHTTINGSTKISNFIYPELKKLLNNVLN